MKHSVSVLACAIALAALIVFGGVAAGQDYLYIRNSTVSETPKIVESPVGSLGEIDFLDNPAHLRLDSSFRFLSDSYYLGSFSDISTSDVLYDNGQVAPIFRGQVNGFSEIDGTYCSNYWGMDVGFALEVASGMNLAFVFNYLYGDVRGDADALYVHDCAARGDGFQELD